MAPKFRMGFYFDGHPVAIGRLLYILCAPKPRFTPELDHGNENLTDAQVRELDNFIANQGKLQFCNSINRQGYVPVTRADLARFLFGSPADYAERPQPWSAKDVRFTGLVVLSLLNVDEFNRYLGKAFDG